MSLQAGAPTRKKRVIEASDDSDDEPLAQKIAAPAAKKLKQEDSPAPTSSVPVNGQKSSPSSDDRPLASAVPPSTNGTSKRSAPESSDEDDAPLAKTATNGKKAEESEDSSDDAPLAKTVAPPKKAKASSSKPAAKKAKKAKADSDDEAFSEEEEKPKPKAKKAAPAKKKAKKEDSEPASPVKKGKGKAKAKKEEGEEGEEEEEDFKWWEQQAQGDGSTKWTSLKHNGVLFAPPYVPHGIKMKYKGQDVDLLPEAEEVATFFGSMLNTDHVEKPVFRQNFFNDFKMVLKEFPPLDGTKITNFEDCDFKPIFDWCELEREKKKAMTKEEKKLAKQAKDILEEPYRYAYLDGRKEKVGNFRIEPPSLFRGRGAHPKTGMLKKRVQPEQITINIGPDDPVPEPPAGHKWGKVTHDNKVTWLAGWNENINNANKYVFLAAGSSLKGQSDMKKFEKARELKKHIDRIRKDYTADLTDKVMATRQRATALYLIDRFALRAGNEKGDDEADTVGCCSLRCEHVTLAPPTSVSFDFLGKDSIRYHQTVDVDEQVFKNMRIFKKNKDDGDDLFDRLTTTLLNKHLGEYMKGLSAKVFRTYNASWTFQNELDALTNADDSIADKILAYNRANRRVAILCNHQKSVSKTHGAAMEKMADKLRAMKYQRMKLRHALFSLDSKNRKRHKELDEDESDLDEDWIEKHEEEMCEKAKEQARKKFEKDTEKAKAAGDDPPDEDTLEAKIKDADDELKRLKKERKSGDVEVKGAASEDKILSRITKIDERIAAHRTATLDKDEGKETSLGTSKLNYIDPRLTYAWCAKYEVPVEKMFSKTLREKFTWAAQAADADWRF